MQVLDLKLRKRFDERRINWCSPVQYAMAMYSRNYTLPCDISVRITYFQVFAHFSERDTEACYSPNCKNVDEDIAGRLLIQLRLIYLQNMDT